MVIHSSFSDFVLFLYVHVAHIDNTYDPKEIALIKSKMKGLFPDETDLEKKLYQTIRDYNRFDRSNMAQLCSDTLDHFKDDKETSKSRLYSDVQDIINADGKIEDQETEVFRRIKKMIDEQVFS
jgi:uncharacterized tellurite resistance protein B-like protein